jgi:hypothetical protein
MAEGMSIGRIDVYACRGGYAAVLLHTPPPEEVDPLPVFLKNNAGRWTIVGYGPDVDCPNVRGSGAEVEIACDALGLR